MHLKHALAPVTSSKLVWDRVTASRLAIAYFVFSILHCTVQVFFQFEAFYVNKHAADFLSGLINTGNATFPGFFVLGSQLRFCDHVPTSFSTQSCQVVWNGTFGEKGDDRSTEFSTEFESSNDDNFTLHSSTAPTSPPVPLSHTPPFTSRSGSDLGPFKGKRSLFSKPQVKIASYSAIALNGQTGVTLQSFGNDGKNVTLDNKCLVSLNWPVQTLRNTKREDIAFIGFQFWVLGVSLVALLNESIPHIIATALMHLSSTAWGAFQIYNTNLFHNQFTRLTTNGACQINLLPNYWIARSHAEIPSLAFNAAALLLSYFLTVKLIKSFGWQTFKRVGASRSINRIYKLILTLSIIIQLSLFFVISAVALWLDQLFNGAIAVMATQSRVYEIVSMIILVLLIPWLLMGWFAARKELKLPMAVFLVLCALYLIAWGLMFDSTTFRWTFIQWTFFGAMATISAILALIDLIVGIMCRLNFDKGMANYLNGHESLYEETFIQARSAEGNAYDEKIVFPPMVHPAPTFLPALGPNPEVGAPGQVGRQLGHHLFDRYAAPVVQRVDIDIESVMGPPAVRPTSPESAYSTRSLVRAGSQQSTSSTSSSTLTLAEPTAGRFRWVIDV